MTELNGWTVLYEKALRDDGSLFFPERLSKEFLDKARRTMGSYIFANQYQNEIIPDDEKRFKASWLKYFKTIPKEIYSFAFIDPAIGQKNHHDYTGICVIDVDTNGTWYLRVATRDRLTPTQIVDKMFEMHHRFNLKALGVETVAYQESLLYFLDEECKKRKVILPVKAISHRSLSKDSRILALVPRFEWGRIYLAQGLTDFEDEYSKFPRASHDDLLDSLASLEEIVFYPLKKENKIEKPNSPADPNYERWFIQNQLSRAQRDSEHDSNY